ncbi:Crp/Fnr family transcriptional regulator [Streptococcus chenjunshii]|uniref:Crp/Fnr family transcriptional regulator n=1 Tax=Streptococcus chenjunshii TaxID=2173853 RepID=A0A372KLI7_9STRE|nr:Crp/Fnr family transcriptional regulator [Streptococcus chenjunshii]AXQ79044.1 Crp/Fnr family transcriptional regulator [Streptococcus chenjunshii]RFU51240.1 Crp/Fnr family transcriptional regulator [Streptococcus chenjunshii]RFU53145.1 Crp/Fnr family transcriptional regulator [Streptococcus chenjunshii]
MDLEFFKSWGEVATIPKGGLITRIGPQETISSIYLLEEGIASLVSVTEKGEQQTHQYFTEPSFLTIVPFLTRARLGFENGREVAVVAKTACKVWKIPSDLFLQKKDDPAVLTAMLDAVLQDYIFAMNKQEDNNTGSTLVHLCRFINEYAQKKGQYRRLNKVFTYAEIASFLKVHEVSVARLIKDLKEAGIIEKRGHGIMIRDEKKLEDWANSQV